MSSFMQLLHEAREENKIKTEKLDTVLNDLSKTDSKDIDLFSMNEEKHIEPLIEEEVKPEKVMSIGDKIIQTSANALLCKSLKGSGASKRLAKAISVRKHITPQQLKKAFNIQSRVKPAHHNYQLVGGDAMMQLKTLLESGTTLGVALETIYKD